MRRGQLLEIVICLFFWGVSALVWAQEQTPVRLIDTLITLKVENQPAANVAAEITKQSNVQVGIVGPCTASVTLDLQDTKLEEAIKLFAKGIEASWIRVYVIEPAPPATPYTPDQLYAGLSNQRQSWMDSLGEEGRNKLFEQWRNAGVLGRFGGPGPGGQGQTQAAPQPPPEMPGAGRSDMPRRLREEAQRAAAQGGAAPQPGQGGPGGRFGFRLDDPVGDLIIPLRTETVTLNLQDVPLQQALFELMTASGFIVAASPSLQGNITLQAENKPLEEVIAHIASAVNAQWRPIYLLSVPRQLSEEEQEQRMEQRFQNQWARFWAMPPEQRQQEIQRRVQRLTDFAERMQRDPQLAARMRPRMQRMLGRMVRYVAGLTPEQRMELKPLMRAMGQAAGQPQQ